MSIVLPELPAWLQNGIYPARVDRQLIDAVWSEGVHSGLAVTPRAEGANFSVDVAAGRGVVLGDDQSAQGSYLLTLTGKVNVPIGVPASQNRIDLVVLRVNDPQAGGPTGDNGAVGVIAGTPGSTPAPPALPASAIELARVTVASGAASILSAAIDQTMRVGATVRPAARTLIAVVALSTDKTSTNATGLVAASASVTIGPGRRLIRAAIQAMHQRTGATGLTRSYVGIDGTHPGVNYQTRHDILGGPGGEFGGVEGYFNVAAGVHSFEYKIQSPTNNATAFVGAGSKIFFEDCGPASGLITP